jgi:hypothetical protein
VDATIATMIVDMMMIDEMIDDVSMTGVMIAAGTMIGNDHQRRAKMMIENNNDRLHKVMCYAKVLSFVGESVGLKRTVPLWILGIVNEDSFIFRN